MAKITRSRDINERAKQILDLATGETKEPETIKNAAAVELGRLGGLKGGRARADKLSPERRKEIAVQAAKKRWNKE